MTVEESVTAALPDGLQESPLATIALELARQLDGRNSATSKSMIAKALVETLEKLNALVPPIVEEDEVGRLRRKREERESARRAAGKN